MLLIRSLGSFSKGSEDGGLDGHTRHRARRAEGADRERFTLRVPCDEGHRTEGMHI